MAHISVVENNFFWYFAYGI